MIGPTLYIRIKPLMLMSKVITAAIVLGILSALSVSLAVAVPWSLLVAACITFSFDE